MKTLVRTLIVLCLVVWIGAEVFFPVVAAVTFATLTPDTHTAGRIVGSCLRTLHYEGLAAGAMLLVLLMVAGRVSILARKHQRAGLTLVAVMLSLTAVSQWGILPRMETYRLEAGGTVDAAAMDDPARMSFNRLHKTSEHIEELVLVFGLVLLPVLVRSQDPVGRESVTNR